MQKKINSKKKAVTKVLVAFDDSIGGQLKSNHLEDLKNLRHNKDFKVFMLKYRLDCGDISNLPFSNAEIYEDLGYDDVEEIYETTQETIQNILAYNKKATIELFVQLNKTEQLCNLYFFANQFKGLENIYLNYFHEETEKVYDKKIKSEVIHFYIVVDKRVPLTEELISTFTTKWQKLASNNAAVRESAGGEIKEYSLQEAKDKILTVFSKEYRRFPRLYVDFLEKCEAEETSGFSYIAFEYICKKLIEENVIERTMKTDTQSGSSDIYFEQDFRLRE